MGVWEFLLRSKDKESKNVSSVAISVASSMLDDVHREVAKKQEIGLLYIIFPFAYYSVVGKSHRLE